MNHEQAFVRSFVLSEKQHRWTELLFSKRRSPFIHRLADPADIDIRWAIAIPRSEQTPKRITELLVARGAPGTCHIISEYDPLDGCDMDLSEAIEGVWGISLGSVVSCLPGSLPYYEGEIRTRFILQRHPA